MKNNRRLSQNKLEMASFFIDIAGTNQLFHYKISPPKTNIYCISQNIKMRMQYILLFEAYIFTICCYSVVLSQAK